ncbi:hypothetical protein Tsubulata_000397, partial [Turnera subulata]
MDNNRAAYLVQINQLDRYIREPYRQAVEMGTQTQEFAPSSITEMQEPVTAAHIVAIPFPGRGHINPLMNFCRVLAGKRPDICISFVITEERLGFMEAPFERLLDGFDLPPTLILADTFMFRAVTVGNRRNILVASFFPMSSTVFFVFLHFDLLAKNGHFPANLSGVAPIRLIDLPQSIYSNNSYKLDRKLELFLWVREVQFLLFTSVYELESQAVNALKATLPFPVYTIGPAIPYFNLGDTSSSSTSDNDHSYWKWLDSQPLNS